MKHISLHMYNFPYKTNYSITLDRNQTKPQRKKEIVGEQKDRRYDGVFLKARPEAGDYTIKYGFPEDIWYAPSFIPFAFDTFGFLAPEAVRLLNRVQKVVNSNSASLKVSNYVFSRIGFAIQKGVAAQLVARLPAMIL